MADVGNKPLSKKAEEEPGLGTLFLCGVGFFTGLVVFVWVMDIIFPGFAEGVFLFVDTMGKAVVSQQICHGLC